MSIFGFYFVTGLLREAGWPRKQGLFKGDVIDNTVLDSAVDQMLDWAAALGACRPTLALQVIAEMFRDRNWDGGDAPDIGAFVEEARNGLWNRPVGTAPHEVVRDWRFVKTFGKTMDLPHFKDARTRDLMEQDCLGALLWGLGNPNRFKEWYELMTQEHGDRLPLMRQAGLAVDSLPELPQHLVDSEDILRSYEHEIRPLPSIPSKLLADARALGVDVDGV